MKKYMIAVVSAVAIGLSGCSSMNMQDILNNPQVQAIIAQAEQYAIQFAESWIASHLGASRASLVAPNSAGVVTLKGQLMSQYHMSDKMAEDMAIVGFAKAASKASVK
jgi:predicted small secreted protein